MNKVKDGKGIGAFVKVRCDDIEEDNKYLLGKEKKKCILCEKGRDNMKHFVTECEIAKEWFEDLEKNKEERIKRMIR